MKYSSNLQFCEHYGYKKSLHNNQIFPPSLFIDAGSVIRDGKKSGSRMNISDPQHWLLSGLNWNFFSPANTPAPGCAQKSFLQYLEPIFLSQGSEYTALLVENKPKKLYKIFNKLLSLAQVFV